MSELASGSRFKLNPLHPRGTMAEQPYGRTGYSALYEVHQDRLCGGDRAVPGRRHCPVSAQRLTTLGLAELADPGGVRPSAVLAGITSLAAAFHQDDDGRRQAAL